MYHNLTDAIIPISLSFLPQRQGAAERTKDNYYIPKPNELIYGKYTVVDVTVGSGMYSGVVKTLRKMQDRHGRAVMVPNAIKIIRKEI
jgi:hypothetical protein